MNCDNPTTDVHLPINPEVLVTSIPDFGSYTNYLKNNTILNQGNIYRAKESFTSTGGFDIADWDVIFLHGITVQGISEVADDLTPTLGGDLEVLEGTVINKATSVSESTLVQVVPNAGLNDIKLRMDNASIGMAVNAVSVDATEAGMVTVGKDDTYVADSIQVTSDTLVILGATEINGVDSPAGTPPANGYIWVVGSDGSGAWTLPATTAHAASHIDGGSDELTHDSLAGSGTESHVDIDAHIADGTLHVGVGTLAQIGGVEEAASDGKYYARKDAGWAEVTALGGIQELVEDTSPTLGGDLDTGGFSILSGFTTLTRVVFNKVAHVFSGSFGQAYTAFKSHSTGTSVASLVAEISGIGSTIASITMTSGTADGAGTKTANSSSITIADDIQIAGAVALDLYSPALTLNSIKFPNTSGGVGSYFLVWSNNGLVPVWMPVTTQDVIVDILPYRSNMDAYTSGSYQLPIDPLTSLPYRFNDFKRIELISTPRATERQSVACMVTVLQEQLEAQPSNLRMYASDSSGEVAVLDATSTTTFDIGRYGLKGVVQVIGYLK